ncbi:uncharacterized protein LOC105697541 [Orussus abietinus]|uniref:uncharacterized protein LOC105697541 n=1 Tax=Orussus abietinus TaxID=222816 RepID=UPI000626E4F3|nr:uncharacterized protein LOC105697541 [Orussus abietinus]
MAADRRLRTPCASQRYGWPIKLQRLLLGELLEAESDGAETEVQPDRRQKSVGKSATWRNVESLETAIPKKCIISAPWCRATPPFCTAMRHAASGWTPRKTAPIAAPVWMLHGRRDASRVARKTRAYAYK